jgi:RNA polymerase sigma-70 factor (ECF subfamily)
MLITSDPQLDATLAAARRGDQSAFAELAEPHRRELLAHCYRLTASAHEAEDQVQETMLRAWRRLETYAGRASFRAWLYRIATNACLDLLDRRSRRALPSDRHPAADPAAPLAAPIFEPIWLEPFPDEWLSDATVTAGANPETRYTARESVRLAFIAALQTLPPRQRAVLLLRDVLDWSAAETATCLDMTVPAANSALHRARATLARHEAAGRDHARPALDDPAVQQLLERYLHAWETADVDGLVALLREDAVATMPPTPTWFKGRAAIGKFASAMFNELGPGRQRLLPARANAQPAFALYVAEQPGGPFAARGLQVLTPSPDRLTRLDMFLQPDILRFFNLPSALH